MGTVRNPLKRAVTHDPSSSEEGEVQSISWQIARAVSKLPELFVWTRQNYVVCLGSFGGWTRGLLFFRPRILILPCAQLSVLAQRSCASQGRKACGKWCYCVRYSVLDFPLFSGMGIPVFYRLVTDVSTVLDSPVLRPAILSFPSTCHGFGRLCTQCHPCL